MPLWSGNLAFGLVSVPVWMVGATSSHRTEFRTVHRADMGRVHNRKTCELDGQVLQAEDIGRAYETAHGELVALSETELAGLPLPTVKTIEITGFLPLDAVRPSSSILPTSWPPPRRPPTRRTC
jgi:DNA end-binding protein Ku